MVEYKAVSGRNPGVEMARVLAGVITELAGAKHSATIWEPLVKELISVSITLRTPVLYCGPEVMNPEVEAECRKVWDNLGRNEFGKPK